ncbi:MAG: translation initiation factor IF-3 [Chloroflexi bacterium]|nr:translation initiation factor IF-3 [Chloroflexota bacterium]
MAVRIAAQAAFHTLREQEGIAIAREYRVNERIRVPQVRVIDERGEQFGVMTIADALALAREHDLDLVEVAPNSDPPVCRLLDYGKFRYLQSTKEREMRRSHKNVGLREVRFRPRIGRHDIEAKERLVVKLLDEGNKVKVSVMHRGRELDHRDLSVGLLKQVHEAVKESAKLEQPPKQEGRFISIVLAPAKTVPSRADTVAVKETQEDAEDENA